MLAKLNALVPEVRRDKVDRQLVRGVIGLIEWDWVSTGSINWGINFINQYGDDLKNVQYSLKKSMIYGLHI